MRAAHVSLNRKESAILRLMTLRKPKLVETYELLELLTDSDGELPPKSAVEVLISRLRKKLKDNGIEREMLQIKSEHGLGYSIQGRISIRTDYPLWPLQTEQSLPQSSDHSSDHLEVHLVS